MRFGRGNNSSNGVKPKGVQQATLQSAEPVAMVQRPPAPIVQQAQGGWSPASVLREIMAGRSFSGYAELRYHNAMLRFVILVLVVAFAYVNFLWFQHSNKLADQQWIVFHDVNGTTTPGAVAEFRTGPSDEEIRNRAWEVIRWILGAGSSNVDISFAEAKSLMTTEMATEFEAVMGNRRATIKDLRIYKKLEGGRVQPLTEKMLPPGSRLRPTRYDIAVTGVADTYREGTQDKIATGPFAYHVSLVPLDRRTVENPYGLLVSGIQEIDFNLVFPQTAPAGQQQGKEGASTKETQPPHQ
jgi:hypothetical protein